MKKLPDSVLKPTLFRPLRVAWERVPNYHGVLVIEIAHSAKERELYRLQQCPRDYYLKLLTIPDPEQLVNQLLTMYLTP